MPAKQKENKKEKGIDRKEKENDRHVHVVIHYGEIALKGNNRISFEKLLRDNILKKCGNLAESCIKESGQFSLILAKGADSAKNIEKLKDVLTKIPGIAYFSFAKKSTTKPEDIAKTAEEMLAGRKFETFKVNTKRRDKSVPLTSPEYNVQIGELILNKEEKKADMKNPDVIVKVEVQKNCSYVSTENSAGVGGMPTDTKQKVAVLLSGGFDSPVAAYMMMKRGCEALFVHFHNKNQSSAAMKSKIIQLAEQLSKFQIKTKLFIVPFDKVQKELIMKVKADMRMIAYRQFMLRISAKIAEVNGAKFLVVGDSLAQVASQTFANLQATYKSAESETGMHIFSPLIGMDKQEIINISKRIGTYDISILPYGDCCSYFVPKHPQLRTTEDMIKQELKEFDIELLIKEAVDGVEVKEWK